MTAIHEHDYPGRELRFWRPTDAMSAPECIATAFTLFAGFVRVFEVELEIIGAEGWPERCLRAWLPPGVGARVQRPADEFVEGEQLAPAEIAAWVTRVAEPFRAGGFREIVVRTGALAARPPASIESGHGYDLYAHGDVFHRAWLERDGARWFAGPLAGYATSAPLELSIAEEEGRWCLAVNLVWDAWELEGHGLDARVQTCLAGVTRTGWIENGP